MIFVLILVFCLSNINKGPRTPLPSSARIQWRRLYQ